MTYEFSDRTRNILRLANLEAQRFYNEDVGTEYLLLAIIKEETSIASDALKNLGIDYQKVCQEVEKFVHSNPEDVMFRAENAMIVYLRHSPRTQNVLNYAVEEAYYLNHNFVGSVHILLGLLREDKGVAAKILMGFGLQLDDVRREVMKLIGRENNSEQTRRARRRELIEALEKELHCIAETINTCNELLAFVREFKVKMKQQSHACLDEMPLSERLLKQNIIETGTIKNNVKMMIYRCEGVHNRVLEELEKLESQDARDYGGSKLNVFNH